MPLKKISRQALRNKQKEIEDSKIPIQEEIDLLSENITNLQNRKDALTSNIAKKDQDINDLKDDSKNR